jgi:hypothetical protein
MQLFQTIFIEICFQVVHIIMFLMCHYNTCYYENNRLSHYITISNETLATILICQGTRKYGDVPIKDRDKLSVVGLITYILIVPCLLVMIVTSILQLFYSSMTTVYSYCYDYVIVVGIILLALNSYSLSGNKKAN